jgi:hypothetical protein
MRVSNLLAMRIQLLFCLLGRQPILMRYMQLSKSINPRDRRAVLPLRSQSSNIIQEVLAPKQISTSASEMLEVPP